MITIDDVVIVYEGIHRLRWGYSPSWATPVTAIADPLSTVRIVRDTWPEKCFHASLLRRIEHGQRTIVILDGKNPKVTLPRASVPTVPRGTVEVAGHDTETCTLLVPPLAWLGSSDRIRGEVFLANAPRIREKSSRPGTSQILAEADFIGTRIPLRFVYSTTPMTFSGLRELIQRLFDPGYRSIDGWSVHDLNMRVQPPVTNTRERAA